MDYDYALCRIEKKYDLVYINNNFKEIHHKDSVITIYTKEDMELKKDFVSRKYDYMISWAPHTLLQLEDWEYAKDTTIDGKKLRQYTRSETEITEEEDTILVIHNIYILKAQKVLEKYERKAHFNGKNTQNIIFTFYDYDLSNEKKQLDYQLPEQYRSHTYQESNVEPLAVGQKAPDFKLKALNGKPVNFGAFKGKKILLDFSVAGCGWCRKALDKFNQEDYQLADNIVGFYINPHDDADLMNKYRNQVNIPFPVIISNEMGDAYGVSVFPTFFLIDEKGYIEQVALGYDQKFLDSIQKQ